MAYTDDWESLMNGVFGAGGKLKFGGAQPQPEKPQPEKPAGSGLPDLNAALLEQQKRLDEMLKQQNARLKAQDAGVQTALEDSRRRKPKLAALWQTLRPRQLEGFRLDGEADERLADEAVVVARGADVVIAYLGLDESDESEGFDREHIDLAARIIDIIFARHPMPGIFEQARQRIAHHGAAAMAHMHGARGIGGDIFDIDRLVAADTVDFAFLQHTQ